MTTLTSIDLDTVTGGAPQSTQFVSPCLLDEKLTIGDLKKMPDKGKDTLALNMAQCDLGQPSKKLVNSKKHILFAVPPNAR